MKIYKYRLGFGQGTSPLFIQQWGNHVLNVTRGGVLAGGVTIPRNDLSFRIIKLWLNIYIVTLFFMI